MEYQWAVSTDKEVSAAVAAVEAALVERKFSVLWALDINAKLAEKGLSTGTVLRILEVCNAFKAREALDTNPTVGYFLPCKVVIYRRPGEATQIGMVRPTALMGLLGDAGLEPLAAEVEATLTEAIMAAR